MRKANIVARSGKKNLPVWFKISGCCYRRPHNSYHGFVSGMMGITGWNLCGLISIVEFMRAC